MVRGLATQWPAAGLFAGPIAWATSTQLNYALTAWFCAGHTTFLLALGIGLAAVSIFGALISSAFHNPLRARPETRRSEGGEPRNWLATVGFYTGVLFALIILTQAAAGFFLTGCER
jgi:hypothetical protein